MGKCVIRDTKSGIKFDLKTTGDEAVLTSEVYSSLRSCRNGIASVARNAPIAALEDQTEKDFAAQKCPKFEVYTDKAGELRFRLKAKNGQIIGVSGRYQKKASCLSDIDAIRKNAIAKVEDAREAK